ncbi:hypothetical protein DERF_011700 [Dermatophagoides farinae]|uniref:Uncharacterized protein n=1 Tax=Dermatophagoides farinae TaxID=6954 RepID=A0A922HWL5_DERFA|nr:hypothetical protein DERF_011700 [Dermatophagoides farinae]
MVLTSRCWFPVRQSVLKGHNRPSRFCRTISKSDLIRLMVREPDVEALIGCFCIVKKVSGIGRFDRFLVVVQ